MKHLCVVVLAFLFHSSSEISFPDDPDPEDANIYNYNVKFTYFGPTTFEAVLTMLLKFNGTGPEQVVLTLHSTEDLVGEKCDPGALEDCKFERENGKLKLTIKPAPDLTKNYTLRLTYKGNYKSNGLESISHLSEKIYVLRSKEDKLNGVFPCLEDVTSNYAISLAPELESKMKLVSNLPSLEGDAIYPHQIGFVIGNFDEICSRDDVKTYGFSGKERDSFGCNVTSAAVKMALKYLEPEAKTMTQVVLGFDTSIAYGLIAHSESDFFLNKTTTTAMNQLLALRHMVNSIGNQWLHSSITSFQNNVKKFLVYFLADEVVSETDEDYAMMAQLMLHVQGNSFEEDTNLISPLLDLSSPKRQLDWGSRDLSLLRGLAAVGENYEFIKNLQICAKKPNQLTSECLINELKNTREVEDSYKDTWTKLYYPVLHVEMKEKGIYNLIQEPFEWSGNLRDAIWPIPVTYITDEKLHNLHWMKDKETNFTLSNTTLKLLNYRQSGYYRVNYDQQMWKDIIAQLKSNLTVVDRINRAQLIDDVFSLARSTANFSKDTPDYATAFKLFDYIEHEEDYIPLSAAFTAFSFLETKLYGETEYDRFKSHVKTLIAKVYDNLKINMIDIPMDYLDRMRFKLVSLWACRLEHRACVDNAVKLFEKYLDGEYQLHPDLEDIVYCAAARESIQFARIITVEKDHAPEDRKLFYNGVLSCSKYEKHIERLVKENLISGDMDLMEIMKGNPGNFEIVANYMKKNYKEIVNESGTSYWKVGFFWLSKFSNAKVAHEMLSLISDLAPDPFLNKLSKWFEVTIDWKETNLKRISDWLLKQ